jgi:hypothetical protein
VTLKYRISHIGWYNFELLVQTLLKVLIGPGVTAFGGSKDRGRDAAYSGPATFPSPANNWIGQWIFQVKYVDVEEQGVGAARSSLTATLRKELPTVLSRHSVVNNYILLTDVPLTSQSRSELERLAGASGFTGNFAVVDGKEICQFLDIHPEIRKTYPQLLGLADLEIVINRDLYARSQSYLESWQPKLATYVQTEAHARAVSLLKKTHFIVLDGPPEAGKSTIAAALALIHAADGFEIIDVRASNDLFKTADPDGEGIGSGAPKLYVADDAIGSLSLEDGRAEEWSRDLPGIVRKLGEKRLLIWTARRYILEDALAKSRLRDAVAEFPASNEVLVEVGELTELQKAEMLYNHAKQADLSAGNKELIKSTAARLVNHPNFSPLRVRQLTTVVMKPHAGKSDTKAISEEDLFRFFDDPGERWVQAYRALSVSEQMLLTSTLDFSGPSPANQLKASYEMRVEQSGHRHLNFEECIVRLDHSFLSVTTSHNGERQIDVQHPSLSEILLLELRSDPQARKRYFRFANPFALSRVIAGVSQQADSRDQPDHSIVPKNDDEMHLFLDRLLAMSQKPMEFRDWDMLLSAAERLLPIKPTVPKPSDSPIRWPQPAVEPVGPSEMDLESFSNSRKGQTLRAILQAMATGDSFGHMSLGPDGWTRLLSHFYRLTAYTTPPIYPTFASTLLTQLDRSLDSVRLLNLFHRSEPIVVKQRLSEMMINELVDDMRSEALGLIEEGQGFGEEDDPNEFDDWDSRATKFLRSVREFVEWAIPDNIETLDELASVRESVQRPQDWEESGEYEDGPRLPNSGPYWTVGRLFEDL